MLVSSGQLESFSRSTPSCKPTAYVRPCMPCACLVQQLSREFGVSYEGAGRCLSFCEDDWSHATLVQYGNYFVYMVVFGF